MQHTIRIASVDLLPKSRCVHQTAVNEMTVAAGESMRGSRKDLHSWGLSTWVGGACYSRLGFGRGVSSAFANGAVERGHAGLAAAGRPTRMFVSRKTAGAPLSPARSVVMRSARPDTAQGGRGAGCAMRVGASFHYRVFRARSHRRSHSRSRSRRNSAGFIFRRRIPRPLIFTASSAPDCTRRSCGVIESS